LRPAAAWCPPPPPRPPPPGGGGGGGARPPSLPNVPPPPASRLRVSEHDPSSPPPPLGGGGGGGAPVRKPAQDHPAHRTGLAEHVVVQEPKHPEPAGAQERIAMPVVHRIRVLAAIDLHHEPRGQAGEIDDVRTDGMLPAEAVAIELAHAQAAPEAAFGVGHGCAQFAGAIAFLALAHPCVLVRLA